MLGPDILTRVHARMKSELSRRYEYLGYWDAYYMQKYADKVLRDYMASVRPLPEYSVDFKNGSIEVNVWFPDDCA